MSSIVAFSIAIAGCVATGAGLARGLALFTPDQGRLERLALAWGLGSLQVTTLLFWGSLVGIPLGPVTAWTVFAPGLLGWLRPRSRPTRAPDLPASDGPTRRPRLTALVALVLALAVGRTAAITFSEPVTWGDAYLVWQFKGRAFHADGDIKTVLRGDVAYANRDYPLHVPLASAHAYGLAGAPDDFLAKALSFVTYLAILALAHAAFRRYLGGPGGLFATAWLAALPWLAIHTGGALADVPLAFFLLGAALALNAYRDDGDPRRLGLAAALLYGCLWTKNEGAAVALVALAVAAVLVARAARWRHLVLLVPVLLIVPWIAFRTSLGLPSGHLAGAMAHGTADALARVPEILARTASNAFRPDWLGLWAALLLLIGLRPSAVTRTWPAFAIVGGTLLAYVTVLAITGGDFVWLIQTAFGRLLLQMAPAAAVVVASVWSDVSRRTTPD